MLHLIAQNERRSVLRDRRFWFRTALGVAAHGLFRGLRPLPVAEKPSDGYGNGDTLGNNDGTETDPADTDPAA